MHELAITRGVVDMVAERTAGRRVVGVRMRVGGLTCVVPEALQFCFEVAAAGTPLEGAALVVDEVPGRLACRACGEASEVADGLRLCPCGSGDVAVTAGEDLQVVSVELLKEDACV